MSSKKHKTPAIRFKGFTAAWEQRKLEQLAQFNPKSSLPDKFEYVDLESVVGTEMISHRTETKENAPSRAQRLAIQGDVFYQTVRPYQKNNYLFDLPHNNYVFSTGYAQLRPFGDSYFLLSRLQDDKFVFNVLERSTGTSYPAINSSDLAQIEVGVPLVVEEQIKIGDFFKNLDNTIALHQRQLDNYKELKKVMLQKVFNQKLRFKDDNGNDYPEWESVTLNKICYIKTGNMNVQDSVVEGQYTFFDRSETIKKLDTYSYDEEAIIYPGEGSSFYPKYFKGKYALHQRAYSLSDFKEGCSTKYVYHYLNTKNNHFIRTCVGTTVRSLRMKSFETCEVYLPSYLEQQKIADFLDTMDNQINQISKKVERLREEKKGLLQQMFV